MSIRHHGWMVSPYSAKTRSYLRYVGLDFEDLAPSAWALRFRIQEAVGRAIMPTVELPDGRWLQDSSDIIDHFEREPQTASVHPDDPVGAFGSALLEVFADEWLPMSALHYRWSLPDNARFAIDEFAACGLPWVPRLLARRLVRPVADRMAGYREVLGVNPATIPGVEDMTATTIAALQATLTDRPFLLGGRPCVGDFALYGPLWAHLYRDPASRFLFDDAPAVVDWMSRLTEGARATGAFEATIPAALDPLIQGIIDDQLAWNRTLSVAIDAWCDAHPDAHRVPRALGHADFTVAGQRGRRKLITFVQYKAQRTRSAYSVAPRRCDAWLARFSALSGEALVPPIAHPMERVGFRTLLRDRPGRDLGRSGAS